MLRIEGSWGHGGWNVLDKLVLEIVIASSQSLIKELRSNRLEIVIALGGDLIRSEGIFTWHKSSNIVTQALLLAELNLAVNEELHAVRQFLRSRWEVKTVGKISWNETSRNEAGGWDIIIA